MPNLFCSPIHGQEKTLGDIPCARTKNNPPQYNGGGLPYMNFNT